MSVAIQGDKKLVRNQLLTRQLLPLKLKKHGVLLPCFLNGYLSSPPKGPPEGAFSPIDIE